MATDGSNLPDVGTLLLSRFSSVLWAYLGLFWIMYMNYTMNKTIKIEKKNLQTQTAVGEDCVLIALWLHFDNSISYVHLDTTCT